YRPRPRLPGVNLMPAPKQKKCPECKCLLESPTESTCPDCGASLTGIAEGAPAHVGKTPAPPPQRRDGSSGRKPPAAFPLAAVLMVGGGVVVVAFCVIAIVGALAFVAADRNRANAPQDGVNAKAPDKLAEAGPQPPKPFE